MSGTPPPPPPPVEDTAAPIAPPPPPPPSEIQDTPTPPPPPPPPPTSASQTRDPIPPKTISDHQKSTPEQADQPTPRPRRKRRFSPSAQDPVPVQTPSTAATTPPALSSRIHQPSNTTAASSTTSTKSKPLTANEWEKTAFVGDASGEKRMKFLRLMGLGKSTKIEAKPENAEDASREASRRQQQSYDMERQYEQGRKRQHRFK
ncbi:hypothetical protein BG015_007050 [Linnemannia schmuckeri]|uniref:Small acidic protein n=1 Tax=Linnemannia schmuckeri TaxID=64567 RepID=A0A9P5VF17_9FUNG|nr:hypothetical protein BG015_007050 [Linnemannia schmuckeri]